MMQLTDDKVLSIFREMPGHCGCTEEELRAAEDELGVAFPQFYRQMMMLDADRLLNTGVLIAPRHLAEYNNNLPGSEDDVFVRPRIIFGTDDIRAFYAMDADGGRESAVYEFDHYHATESSKPSQIHRSLSQFFADILRKYFQL